MVDDIGAQASRITVPVPVIVGARVEPQASLRAALGKVLGSVAFTALHVRGINLRRDDTGQSMELGIPCDARGKADAKLNPADVAEVLRRYPRLHFRRVP